MKLYTQQARDGYTSVDENRILDKIRRSLQEKIFFKHVQDRESKILDIGCGGGKFLQILEREGFSNIYGVEPDQNLISTLLDHAPQFENRIRCGTATSLPFSDGSFDCVYFFNVMHHLQGSDEYRQAIYEANRILKVNGIVLMIEPCNAYIYSIKRNIAFSLSLVSKFFEKMYKMMAEERQLMEMYIRESSNIRKIIETSGFEIIQYNKYFHQEVCVSRKIKTCAE